MKYKIGTLLAGYGYSADMQKKPIIGYITRAEITEVDTPLYFIEWMEGEDDNDWYDEGEVRDYITVLNKEKKKNVKI